MKKIIVKILVFSLVLALLIPTLSACSNKNKTVVGKVGSYEVYYQELRWLTMQYKDIMSSYYGEELWESKNVDEKYVKELRDWVYSSIAANYNILTLCDDDILKINGMKAIDINSEEIQNIVSGRINEMIAGYDGGKSEYKQDLKDNYLNEDLHRFIMGIDVCEAVLFNYYCSLGLIDDSDEAAIDYIHENFIRTVHVYIQNDEKDNIEDNKKLANAIKLKLENGEDIDKIIADYSEDQALDAKNGRYFTNNTYAEEYEEAAFALDTYEISDVVETRSGFYVIKRLPMEDEYIGAHFIDDLKDQYLLAVFDKEMEKRKTELTFVPNEYGASLDLVKMK